MCIWLRPYKKCIKLWKIHKAETSNWGFTVYPILEKIYLQCVGLVSAQQAKHIADTPVHSMEGNLTAGQLRHLTGTETQST
jgi:hypothetical protein